MICLKKVLKTELKLRFQLGQSKFHFPGIISRGDYFRRLRCGAILLFHFGPLITSKLSVMEKPIPPTFGGKSLKGHEGVKYFELAVELVKNIPMGGVKARSPDYVPHKETAVNSLCGRFQGFIPTPILNCPAMLGAHQ